ncbi:hypothetical protein QQP08_010550 [Theobroma cacao]|nr:hypothetical protein QQP08_010550 [Theobroma cacao]
MLLVVPWHKVGKWQLLSDGKIPLYNVRVGSCFPFISIACYDIYDNWMPFSSIPDFKIKLIMNEGLLVDVTKMKPFLSSDKLVLNIEHVMIESNELDSIGPHYAATLMIYSKDESVLISVECQVTPGALRNAKACPEVLGNQLLPGFIIEQLILEMFDAYGNHVAEGVEVQFHLDGFVIQEHLGSKYKLAVMSIFTVLLEVKLSGGLLLSADLATINFFSIALKNFGSRHVEKEKVMMKKSGSGEDQPVLVVGPLNKKALGISSDGNIIYKQFDVLRVHKILKRKGVFWESGQRIKVLKGACAGFHKNNVYATLEYFLIEGFQGDFVGEARIICR